jgi:hypothetical protein
VMKRFDRDHDVPVCRERYKLSWTRHWK